MANCLFFCGRLANFARKKSVRGALASWINQGPHLCPRAALPVKASPCLILVYAAHCLQEQDSGSARLLKLRHERRRSHSGVCLGALVASSQGRWRGGEAWCSPGGGARAGRCQGRTGAVWLAVQGEHCLVSWLALSNFLAGGTHFAQFQGLGVFQFPRSRTRLRTQPSIILLNAPISNFPDCDCDCFPALASIDGTLGGSRAGALFGCHWLAPAVRKTPQGEGNPKS